MGRMPSRASWVTDQSVLRRDVVEGIEQQGHSAMGREAVVGTDIYGWVEAQSRGDTWEGVIKIHQLVPRSHRMFSLLFGDKDDDPGVIAGRRGIPMRHSLEVADSLRSGADPIYPSWISYEELAGIDWDLDDWRAYLGHGWTTLLRMMELLAQDIDYGWGTAWGAGRIRLVVWFDTPW
jgi:hypothetical protein